jgi:Ca-activated chloride channel family protein
MQKILFLCLSLLFLFQTSAPAQSDDDETINVDATTVVINAAITDRDGKAALGLKQNQFKIFEDGKEQTIDYFAAEKTPFAAVILIDTSGSMEQRIRLARSAAMNFLDGIRIDDNVAIYNFDSKVSLVQDFSNYRDISEKIFDLKAKGMTVLNDAIFEASQVLDKRPEKRRAIVVLSDGEDTISKRSADKALKAALAANATIYTVDMSSVETGGKAQIQSQGALKNFAEKSGGTFVEAAGGNALRDAFKEIVAELGSQYTIAYQPQNVKKDGKWREIEVRVSKPNLSIRTRKGYNAPKEAKGKK